MNKLGWHFLQENKKLRYPPYTLVEEGQKLSVRGPIKLYKWGLHASQTPLDAIQYAPGPIVCKVRLSGNIEIRSEKMCATERTTLAMGDVAEHIIDINMVCFELLFKAYDADFDPLDKIKSVLKIREGLREDNKEGRKKFIREGLPAINNLIREVDTGEKIPHGYLTPIYSPSIMDPIKSTANLIKYKNPDNFEKEYREANENLEKIFERALKNKKSP